MSSTQHRRTAAPGQHTLYHDPRPRYMGGGCVAADLLLEADNPFEERQLQRLLDSTRTDY